MGTIIKQSERTMAMANYGRRQAAAAAGKTIQFLDTADMNAVWEDCACQPPHFDEDTFMYRVKPEEVPPVDPYAELRAAHAAGP